MTDSTVDDKRGEAEPDVGPSLDELFGDIETEVPETEPVDGGTADDTGGTDEETAGGVEDRTAVDVFSQLQAETESKPDEDVLDESPEAIIASADEPVETADPVDDDLFDADAFEDLILTDRRKEDEFLWVETGDEPSTTPIGETDTDSSRQLGSDDTTETASDDQLEFDDTTETASDDQLEFDDTTETASDDDPVATDVELGSGATSDSSNETSDHTTVDPGVSGEDDPDDTPTAAAGDEDADVTVSDEPSGDEDRDSPFVGELDEPVDPAAGDAGADAVPDDPADPATTASDAPARGSESDDTAETDLVPVTDSDDDPSGFLGWLRSKLGGLF